MRIVLLHYHLRPGGVTQVILSQRAALEKLGHEVIVPELPEFDYLSEPRVSPEEMLTLLREVAGKPDLWIIHNALLGKHQHFPELIQKLAEQQVPLILQCHDFAEDGRPANYAKLQAHENLYPIASHIHYATINSRDAHFLKKAGLPNAQLHFLPNAVHREKIAPPANNSPLILYPVRAIRRKNIGEFCLWARLAPKDVRFAVAKAPENGEWLSYYQEWEQFAMEEGLPIEFDVVSDERPFSWWLEQCTHLATTSVAEGFGLTFLEPHFFQRPLIGRNLPAITQDFTSHGLTLGTLYDRIPVPSHVLEETTYNRALNNYFAAYSQSPPPLTLQNWIPDFGNLPEDIQRNLIRNGDFSEFASWLTNALTYPAQEKTPQNWSIEAYSYRLAELLEKVINSPVSTLSYLKKEKVLAEFLKPECFHFLRS